jgi:hypothetical protein
MSKLEQCSKQSCAKFDRSKEQVQRETEEKMSKINDLISKDFKKWKVLADKIQDEQFTKLHNRYICIIERCEKELKEQIKADINSQKTYIKYLLDPKQHSNKPSHVKQREVSLKKARKDLESLEKLLVATKLQPQDVRNQLRLL